MNIRFLIRNLTYLCLLLLASCTAPDETRPGVPVVMGIRMNHEISLEDVKAGIIQLESVGATEVLVEYPLKPVSLDDPRPQVDDSLLKLTRQVIQLLSQKGYAISLSICNSNVTETFPRGRVEIPGSWFESLGILTDSLIKICGPVKIKRLIYGKNLIPIEHDESFWQTLMDKSRRRGIKVSYAVDIDRADKSISLLALGDEIAIVYQPRNFDHMIAYCRENNHRVSALADSLGKPVYIFQANLLGEQPRRTFEYRLKFWDPQVSLSGICINTIYPRFAVEDTFVYYGLKKEREFLEFLHNYSR